MPRYSLFALGLWVAALTLAGPALSATDLTRPDCLVFQECAASLAPDETFTPINTLFRDNQLIPLFGQDIPGRDREDFNAVIGWMNGCRTAANKARDKATAQSLYAAIKVMKNDLRPLKQYWGQRQHVEKDIERMINQKDFAELLQLLALAQQALSGEDVSAGIKALPTRYQGQGRQAATVSERNARHESLLREIAAVPLDRPGLNQLNRIAYQAPLAEMSRAEVDSYNTAFHAKRNAINASMRSVNDRQAILMGCKTP